MNNQPDFYEPDQVGTLYTPDTAAAVRAGQAAGLPPAKESARRVILLLVDPQVDFIHPDGSLSVPGAVEDTRRTIEWVFQHTAELTAIAASLDSHIPTQIFYPTWWIDQNGNHPAAYTAITREEVDQHKWRPVYEEAWSIQYVRELQERAKKTLMIWPYHTMIGTPGHSITPALYEAIAYHAAARQSRPEFLTKGMIPKTEHYSLLEPEVKVPGAPQGALNQDFLGMLASYDMVYVAGQAKSHCVLETITSVMRHFADQPDQIARWRLLTDCMSSVTHPEIDFEAQANDILSQYAQEGLTLVTSLDPLE